MTPDEILKEMYERTMEGNAPRVLELTNMGLEAGLTPDSILFDALIPSLEEVGARFERGDYFVPEMLIAGRAMSGALDVLRPLLADTGAETVGTFLMGTVKGDVHDIGKNLVNIMLEGAFPLVGIGFFIGAFGMGFQVHGLVNDYIKEKGNKRKGSGIDYI